MNRRHDFARLDREFITSQVSLRELCRRHDISAHSLVTVQAKKHKWAEKREAYRQKESESFIEKHAARHADREAEVRDKALDAIDESISEFRADLKATKPVRQPDGSITEEPAWRMTPRDLALLIDRLEVLFDRPSVISEGRGLTVRSELPLDALSELIDRTRRRGAPPTSPLPRTRRLDD